MNTHLLLLCAMFLVLMFNGTRSQGNGNLYSNCSNLFNCGNLRGVGYPFWGRNRSSSCGYRALQLACQDNATSIIISDVKYKVLNFYPNTEVLQIAREDFSSGICSPDFIDTTLDPALFTLFNGYINSRFMYGCSNSPSPNVSSQFSCTTSGTANNIGYVVPEAVGQGDCFKSVVVPISSQWDNSSASLEKIVQQGFEVRLAVDSEACAGCAYSKGVCGYDISKNTTACYCADGSSGSATCAPSAAGGPQGQPGSEGNKSKVTLGIGLALAGAGVTGLLVGFLIFNYRQKRNRKRADAEAQSEIITPPPSSFSRKVPFFKGKKDRDVEKLMRIHGSLVPRRYRYIDLKKMTNSFSKKLGRGGFGTVYKGKMRDGCLVAVKIIMDSRTSPEEFINEVVSISRTSHVNVITLLGFCYEGKTRALVFDYMPNGSLDKFIYSGRALNMTNSLGWKILYQIAIGIARGLEYLHRGCNTRILHFDIKPQNILLDRDFIPKISDFGLAKLCRGQESAVSTPGMRGTVGFIAPEVVFRSLGRVSPKSDVYSYGMLVLEMVGVRDSDMKVSNSSEMYFPEWVYRSLEPGKDLKLPMNVTEEEEVLARKMIIVSLWCIQTSPSDRPPIGKVIEMLEGSFESLQMPPKPVLYSPTLPSSQHWEMTTSNSNGSHEEERILENLEESNNKWQSGNEGQEFSRK